MNIPDKTKEEQIDTIVDELVKTGKLLYLCNKVQDTLILSGLQDTYRAKIKAYREELKQLLKGD